MFLNTKAIKRFFKKGKNGMSASAAKGSFRLYTRSVFLGGEGDFDSSFTQRKLVFSAILAFTALILQESIFNDLRIMGTKPNLVLAVIVLISMSSEPRFAMFLGLFSGLASDVAFGRYLGFYALIHMYICFLTALAVRPFLKGRIVFYMVSGPVFIFTYTLGLGFCARFLALYASRAPVLYEDFAGHILKKVIPSALYTYFFFLVLAVPVTLALRKLGRDKRKGIDFD